MTHDYIENSNLEIFNNKKIISGDKIIINKKTYEVLTVAPDAHPEPKKKDFPARLYLRIDLHDMKSKSLMPTHELDYYWDDTKEIILVNINRKKEKKINPKDLKLIKN